MRTTVTFADDVAAAIDQVRRERSLGLSEAVNELVRAGMAAPKERKPFVQRTHNFGKGPDVTKIGKLIDLMDEMDGVYDRYR